MYVSYHIIERFIEIGLLFSSTIIVIISILELKKYNLFYPHNRPDSISQ